MKIGLYVQTWHVGGVAAFCERLAHGLAARGWPVCLILSTPYGKRDKGGRQAYERVRANKLCPVICLHLNAFHPKERPWRAAEKIAALHCDLLFLSAHKAIAQGLPALAPKTALIGLAHTDDADTYAEFQASERQCDAYAGVSLAIAETLRGLRKKEPPLPIRHIPYGVSVPPGIPSAPAAAGPRFLTVCRLAQVQKRVLDLPLIWRQYCERGGTGTLTICGPGPEEASLRRALAPDIAAGQVHLSGTVPLQQMPAIYAQHDILLSVSAYEGLPIVVLEAASEGLYPVLSQIRSGHQEIIDALGVGRLCPVGDTNAFATALLESSADLQRLRALRPRIREQARSHFSLEKMVETYARLATEIVEARRAGGVRPVSPAIPQPRVDFFRRFLRKWQYSRHYGWIKE